MSRISLKTSLSSLPLITITGLFCAIAAASVPRFVVNTTGGNTVLDGATLLEWEQTASNGSGMTWQEALSHCQNLDLGGHQDWRLPNVVELSTVIDETEANPSINTTYFADFVSTVYWTATTDPSHTTSAYVVYFNNFDSVMGRGGVGTQTKTGAAFVVCTRNQ